MSIAVRRAVPLNSRCSRKCVEPWCPSDSSREPTPTHAPTDADRTPGTCSVSRRTPPGRTERRTDPSPACPAVTSAPGEPGATRGRSSGTSGVGRLSGGVRGLPALGVLDHGVQRQLAARVDLADLDLDLLAHA